MHDIKTLKPNFDGPYNQGYFKPTNRNKYSGTYPIIYRSGWELKLCKLCDEDRTIISWVSEPNFPPFPIPYFHPIEERLAHYNPDYLIMKKMPDDSILRMIIEVKPESQILRFREDGSVDESSMPKKPAANASVKQRKAYLNKCRVTLVNMAKKKAAERLAADYNMTYHFLTESFFNRF